MGCTGLLSRMGGEGMGGLGVLLGVFIIDPGVIIREGVDIPPAPAAPAAAAVLGVPASPVMAWRLAGGAVMGVLWGTGGGKPGVPLLVAPGRVLASGLRGRGLGLDLSLQQVGLMEDIRGSKGLVSATRRVVMLWWVLLALWEATLAW
jgi:hypothetical protein